MTSFQRFDSSYGFSIDPFHVGYLNYEGTVRQKIMFACYGKPGGKPVLRFHGGPGGSSSKVYARLIDVEKDMLVTFDQPGCGLSSPAGFNRDTTTTNVTLNAAEMVREEVLGADVPWGCVTGASWGSTLALLYTQRNVGKVQSLCISGVFLGDEKSLRWWWKDVGSVYPEILELRTDFLGVSPDVSWRRIQEGFVQRRGEVDALKVLGVTESWTMGGYPSPVDSDDPSLLSYMEMFLGYASEDFFLKPKEVISGMRKIRHVPMRVLNGRNDFCTPPFDAWRVAKAAGVNPIIVAGAGHSLADNGLLAEVTHQSIQTCLNDLIPS